MKPLKKSISITIDAPVLARIQELAEWEDRSVSSRINLILKDYLKRLDEQTSDR